MNREEALAERYLSQLGIGTVAYEPDGNIPPDFVVGSRIAIEVSRMTQRVNERGALRSLEELEIPLCERVVKLLAECGPRHGETSWFFMYDYSRPLVDWSVLARQLRRWLAEFRQEPHNSYQNVRIADSFSFDLHPASDAFDSHYELGGYTDDDSGGWVLPIFEEGLEFCIRTKARKVARLRDRYAEWWLVLVDHVTYGLSDRNREEILARVRPGYGWQRVIILNALSEDRPFIVPVDPARGRA